MSATLPAASDADVMNGAEIVLRALKDQGVEVIFGYPGGAVLPIYDAIFQQNAIRHVLVRHEQAAVHAAEGYARSTGKVGCVLVTSGPGATNASPGLHVARQDSTPTILFVGQIERVAVELRVERHPPHPRRLGEGVSGVLRTHATDGQRRLH